MEESKTNGENLKIQLVLNLMLAAFFSSYYSYTRT